ncbi:TetR/AcrR family transcriptional regulator [Ferrimonas lipolytica]|uniref:TetR/AcrR family transcriptional regulator n=1 Tax=Ferrimonas lipolytica TaxID=2724191 RepID=A0A6H1U9P8_9GAMM|nr:TetR/AcrR family transcriptional regulator [Ferrimonas lipolytica]QIZ75775.1 TetR/AcrR family transcriptional regulator [Ferrimonas lipolytica]
MALIFNNKQARKVKIAKVAIGLIKSQGYISLSLNQLAKEAGVSSGTLYRDFKSKEELLVFLFGNVIRNLGDSMKRFYKSELSAKEKVICFNCYQFFVRMMYPNEGFLDLIGLDKTVFENVDEVTYKKFQKLYDELKSCNEIMCLNFIKNGELNSEPDLLFKVLRQVWFLSRGGVFVANHKIIDQRDYSIDDLIDACSIILDQLDWRTGAGRADYRLIKLKLKSEVEQSKQFNWSDY